jgi:hypothetical protein
MVIDLGEPRDELDVSPRPWPRWQRRAAGAVAVLAALLAGGAAAPVRSGLVSVNIRATAADEYMVQDDALYVMRPSRGVTRAGLRTITRYRLPDATEPEWEARLYTQGPVRGASIVDGMLLAIVEEGPRIQTIAVRPDTGREVWRRTGWYYRTAPGRGLFQDNSSSRTQQHFGVDLATGNVRWSRSFPANDQVLVDRDRLLHWTGYGRVELYDAQTGALLATTHITFDPQMGPQVAGDLVLVGEQANGRMVLAAYGRDRLDRRWQADIDLRSEYVSGPCGEAICTGIAGGGGGLRLVDLATGRIRWTAPGWEYAFQAGPYLLAGGAGDSPNTPLALLDPADGHVVRHLGDWSFTIPADDRPMLAVREKGARAVVARIDPIAADVRTLGVIDGVFQCQTGPLVVVCRRSNGSIGVWYPRRKL